LRELLSDLHVDDHSILSLASTRRSCPVLQLLAGAVGQARQPARERARRRNPATGCRVDPARHAVRLERRNRGVRDRPERGTKPAQPPRRQILGAQDVGHIDLPLGEGPHRHGLCFVVHLGDPVRTPRRRAAQVGAPGRPSSARRTSRVLAGADPSADYVRH
jgi:hypothetical protein